MKVLRNIYAIVLGCFILFGCGDKEPLLLLPDSGIVNGGFEFGDFTGWDIEGDTKVISKLDSLKPLQGNFMTLLTTKGEIQPINSSISQTFILNENHQYITFRWNLVFEEFKEQFGNATQDYFTITFVKPDGSEQMLVMQNVQIAAFLHNATTSQTGSMIPAIQSVFFNAYMTGWQEESLDVSAYQGQEVTLRFDVFGKPQNSFRLGVMVDDVDLE